MPPPPLAAPIVTLGDGSVDQSELANSFSVNHSPSRLSTCPPPRNRKPPNYLIRVRPRRKCTIPHISIYNIEVQQTYSRLQGDLQNLASKIGELEQEAEEHV
jgi:hypothetical protein